MAAAAAAAALSNSYSLWLSVPAGSQVGRQLRQEIATQAKAHSAPLFEPHVTLLGGIEGDAESIITKAQELAARIKVSASVVPRLAHGQHSSTGVPVCPAERRVTHPTHSQANLCPVTLSTRA
jgi:hypothetical protein